MRQTRRAEQLPDRSVDHILCLVLDAAERRPAPGLPRRLDALFRELAKPEPNRPADDIEELIWALWISHTEAEAEATMGAAIEALNEGALDRARSLLDGLIARHPDWAEAWNKRATLGFIQRRDAESLADIARTLALEPRHFGAISGYGQICLRHGRLGEARAAFQIALRINPHLQGLAELIDDLKPEPVTLN